MPAGKKPRISHRDFIAKIQRQKVSHGLVASILTHAKSLLKSHNPWIVDRLLGHFGKRPCRRIRGPG